jgi:hypothetical protein
MSINRQEIDIEIEKNLDSSPIKKRRVGRPSLKKNSDLSTIIGERKMPISVTSTKEMNAYELSEATAKKGFVSTPVMKLSPSKRRKSKSVLQNININDSSNNKSWKKTHEELFFITQEHNKNDLNESNNTKKSINSINSINKKQSFSSVLSSSPMSNSIMTSEPNYQPSSPFKTSPIPSDNFKDNELIYNNNNNNKHEEITNNRIINELQSSPYNKKDTGNNNNNQYNESFNKFINSSPVYIPNTATKIKVNSENKMNLKENVFINEHTYNNNNFNKMEQKRRGNFNLLTYKFNYQYKLTLDINDNGKAKIFARVIEKALHQPYEPYYLYNTYNPYNSYSQFDELYNDDDGNNNNYEEEINYENIIPSRYEKYIEECKKYNQQQQEVLRNCMKNDVFLTNQYYNLSNNNYNNRQNNSYLQTLETQNGFELNRKKNNNNNNNYNIKTVNINHIVSNNRIKNNNNNNNKGLSAGVEDFKERLDEENDLLLFNLRKVNKNNNDNNNDNNTSTNDALIALKEIAQM